MEVVEEKEMSVNGEMKGFGSMADGIIDHEWISNEFIHTHHLQQCTKGNFWFLDATYAGQDDEE